MSEQTCPDCGFPMGSVYHEPRGWQCLHTQLAQEKAENERLRGLLASQVAEPAEAAVKMCKSIYAGNQVHRVKGVETIIGRIARKAREAATTEPPSSQDAAPEGAPR